MLVAAALGLTPALPACRTGLQNGVFSKSGVRYRVGGRPQGFRPVKLADNDLAFEAPESGHSIAVNSTCKGYEDVTLPVLTRQLLSGFTAVEVLSQDKRPLDGRDSLFTHVRAKLDGVPVDLMLVVMKKSGCIFDLTYVSPPGHFDDALGAFEQLLQQFQVEEPR